MKLRFVLISEGSSERPLVQHLETLCVRSGADEASGVAPDLSRLKPPPGRTIAEKLAVVLTHEPADLVFVHRDADRTGRVARLQEITDAATAAGNVHLTVPVIPVRALEAWLLVDEQAIRRVAANPRGRMPLPLPHLSAVETDNNPKQTLREALAIASETSGRRLEKLRKEFPKHRAQLLDQLDLDGPLATLRSWQDLVLDVQAAVLLLREDLRQRGRQ